MKARTSLTGLLVGTAFFLMASANSGWAAPLPDPYIEGYYVQGCFANHAICPAYGWPYGVLIPRTNAPKLTLDSPHWEVVNPNRGPFYPGEYTAGTQMSFEIGHGLLRAYAVSEASITDYNPGIAPGAFAGGLSRIGNIVLYDYFQFFSDTLPAGSNVDIEVTVTLHSVINATSPGDCSVGHDGWAGYAGLLVDSSAGYFAAPGELFHSSCGHGSETMSVQRIRHSHVMAKGSDDRFGIVTTFGMQAQAGIGSANGTNATILDASSTGSIFVRVLTPGVTFHSGSGAPYASAAIPEPETAGLLGSAFGALLMIRGFERRRGEAR